MYTSKRKILIPLPPSGTLARKKQLLLIRIAIALFVIIFIVVQLNVINYGEWMLQLFLNKLSSIVNHQSGSWA